MNSSMLSDVSNGEVPVALGTTSNKVISDYADQPVLTQNNQKVAVGNQKPNNTIAEESADEHDKLATKKRDKTEHSSAVTLMDESTIQQDTSHDLALLEGKTRQKVTNQLLEKLKVKVASNKTSARLSSNDQSLQHQNQIDRKRKKFLPYQAEEDSSDLQKSSANQTKRSGFELPSRKEQL